METFELYAKCLKCGCVVCNIQADEDYRIMIVCTECGNIEKS